MMWLLMDRHDWGLAVAGRIGRLPRGALPCGGNPKGENAEGCEGQRPGCTRIPSTWLGVRSA